MSQTEVREPEAAGLSRTAELLLVRLLAAGKGSVGKKKLRDDLAKAGVQGLSDEACEATLSDLRSANLLAEGRGLRLNDAGRERALRVLGLSSLPPRATWSQVRDRYLVAMAAGATGGEDLRTKGRLVTFALKRRFGLTVPDDAPIGTAAAALVCKELGFPGLTDLKELQAAVLGRLLDPPRELPPNGAVEQFIRVHFGAKRGKVDELRQALVAEWVRGGGDAEQAAPAGGRPVERAAPDATAAGSDGDGKGAFDLPAFAATARRAAASSPTGWFGDNKVFIAHAWRQYRKHPAGPALDLPAFKARLLEANRAGLLTLSRADLVAAMDPADVSESETRYLNAEFHFILIEGGTA